MKLFLIGLSISVFLFTGLLSSNNGGTPGGEFPSLFVKGARFYHVTTADLDRDGSPEIIAAGQIGPKKSYRGYIAVYRLENNTLAPVAEDTFSVNPVNHEGKTLPTRIRAVVAVADPVSRQWEIYVAGRAGADESGAGFLRKSIYTGGKGETAFNEAGTLVFQSPGNRYTHGYPLALLKPEGETGTRIVYGGFSSGPGTEGADRADVRVFRTGAGENFKTAVLRPFDTLPIPMRVNALATGDITGDGKQDIVIAGRTKTGNGEKAAFACWSNGKIHYKVLEKENESRFRTLLVSDLDNDGKMEIVTGGRIDVGKVFLARLECWRFQGESFRLVSRYIWTADRSTRLRAFLQHPEHPGKNAFYAVGRTELLNQEELEWSGFVRRFNLNDQRVIPVGMPRYIKNDWETRIRHVVSFGTDQLLIAGFSMNSEKKEKAFIALIKGD